MSTLLRALAIGLALLLSQGMATAATIKNINIGNWFAGAYSDDQTGKFSHCAASSNYKNGITMLFAINRSFGWSIGFSNPKWVLTKGSKYPISFRVDGSDTIDATATAVSDNFVEANLADSSALFESFKHGNLFTLYAAGSTFKFQLTGTSMLLPSLLECVRKFDATPEPSSTNPFVTETPPADTPPAVPTKPSGSDGTVVLDRRAEATSLIANILAKSGVTNFEILGPEDTRKFNSDVAWRAGESFGTMQVLGDVNGRPEDYNAQILASDSKACHDKFFSGSMPDATGSRLFTSCRSDTQTMTIFYSNIKRPKGGYYILATGGVEHVAQGDGKPTRELDNGIRSAAYRVVSTQ